MAAYLSLREFFNNHLPTKRTLQLWYHSIDGTPGICEASMKIIREKAESNLAEKKHQLLLTLQYDDITIRKGLYYCAEKQNFIGFPTYTSTSNNRTNEENSDTTLAKEALVYMVVGTDFKLPVGYELCNGLNSVDRAALTLQVIEQIEAAGARIISLTGDGLAGNKATAEELGARFDLDQPFFKSPTYPNQKIYVLWDPPHMIKLVRKHFSRNQIYHNDQLVDWGLLETIVDKQSLSNFNLCNKLTRIHINWHEKPMNVRLAVETISHSVANTLEQLRKDGYEQFENSSTTSEFIRHFDNGLDVLNFKQGQTSNDRYKQPLCIGTASHIFEFAEIFTQYVTQLEYRTETRSTPILQSRVKMGFLGFYSNFICLRHIYEDYVLNGPLETFYTFQFSQDHLETLFSLIRFNISSF